MKALGSSLVVILLAAAGGPAHAQIYKWVDEAGKTHYSDTAPAGRTKVDTVADRISVYAPDPSIARAAATAGSDPALSDRVDRLERQLHAERLARQQVDLAAFSQAAYERCVSERRVDCDYGGAPYAGPLAVGPILHPPPILLRTSFNGPNAITAGSFTFRTGIPVARSSGPRSW